MEGGKNKTITLAQVKDLNDYSLNSPLQFDVQAIINRALDQGSPIEILEKLLTMRRELKKEFAKKEFDIAMVKFQANCPVIKKTKAGYTKTNGEVVYRYAQLESIVDQVRGLLSDNGFSYSFKSTVDNNNQEVTVTCFSKHELGHCEERPIIMPFVEKTGIMSAPQQVAATITYVKKYAFCDAFGIMTGDDDTDAVKASVEPKAPPQAPEPRTEAQNKHIYFLIKELDTTKQEVDAWTTKLYKKRISELSKDEATKVIEAMKKKLKSKTVKTKKEDQWVEPVLPGQSKEESNAAKLMREAQEEAEVNREN